MSNFLIYRHTLDSSNNAYQYDLLLPIKWTDFISSFEGIFNRQKNVSFKETGAQIHLTYTTWSQIQINDYYDQLLIIRFVKLNQTIFSIKVKQISRTFDPHKMVTDYSTTVLDQGNTLKCITLTILLQEK